MIGMSEETPTCRILPIDAPDMAKTGDSIRIDIRFINDGPTGPTFIRTRDRFGNIERYADTPEHETGDGSWGFTHRGTMPNSHYIYMVEVGHGIAVNPIEITDSKILFILNSEIPPLEDAEIVINLNVGYPVVALTPIIDMILSPGQTITKECLIVSPMESASVQRISFNADGKDIEELSLVYTVNGEECNLSKIHEIASEQTITLGVSATLPVEMPTKAYQIRISPQIHGVL